MLILVPCRLQITSTVETGTVAFVAIPPRCLSAIDGSLVTVRRVWNHHEPQLPSLCIWCVVDIERIRAQLVKLLCRGTFAICRCALDCCIFVSPAGYAPCVLPPMRGVSLCTTGAVARLGTGARIP